MERMEDKMEKYKIKQLTGIFIMAVLAFVACTNEEMEIPGKDEHTLTLTYNIPDAAVTRADYIKASESECAVAGLQLLFFNLDTHGNGSFVASASATLKGGSLKHDSITVTLPSVVEENNEYSVLVIANLEKYMSNPAAYLATFANKTYGRAKEELQMTFPLNGDKYYFPEGYLPMSGMTVKPAGKNEMTVDLLRAAVRIDVAVGEGLTGRNAELRHVELRNVAPMIPLFRTQTIISQPRISSERFDVTAGSNELSSKLYAVETFMDVTNAEVLLKDATCLLVDISDPTIHKDADADKTWYRINLNVDGENKQYLKRNNAYRIVITDIKGPGGSDPDDVYYSVAMPISTVTIIWEPTIVSGGTASEGGENYYELK